MRCPAPSAHTTFPFGSTSTSCGRLTVVDASSTPSPDVPAVPFPTRVLIIPLARTTRRRWFIVSAITSLPSGDAATANGLASSARVACVPSPPKPATVLDPATVMIVPLVSTFRTRLLLVSATYRLPSAARLTPNGPLSPAPAAALPSPHQPAVPFPAIVTMVPFVRTWRTQLLELSAMSRLPSGATATSLGYCSAAEVACPPSPAYAPVPLPATVTIVPFTSTARMRWFHESAM
jgi:hypothetical protein